MANQPDIHNLQRAIRVPRDLDAKVLKKFQLDDMTVKDAYILALEFATRDVVLDSEDLLKIAKDIVDAKFATKRVNVHKNYKNVPKEIMERLYPTGKHNGNKTNK